jgi:hypothetical protein
MGVLQWASMNEWVDNPNAARTPQCEASKISYVNRGKTLEGDPSL